MISFQELFSIAASNLTGPLLFKAEVQTDSEDDDSLPGLIADNDKETVAKRKIPKIKKSVANASAPKIKTTVNKN
jgi:hypothetical protein